MIDHKDCAEAIRHEFTPQEVHVSPLHPITPSPDTVVTACEDHMVLFWVEPTGEQYMKWAAAKEEQL